MKDLFLQIRKQPFQFGALLLILLFGGVLFIVFNYNPETQRNIIYATGAGYFFWSIYHHYKRGDLHISIVIEYLVMIALAALLITQTLL